MSTNANTGASIFTLLSLQNFCLTIIPFLFHQWLYEMTIELISTTNT